MLTTTTSYSREDCSSYQFAELRMSDQHVTVCADPIFVIGSARSGTTILAWSLAKHSQLFNLNESTIIRDLFGDDQAIRAYRASAERPAPTMFQTLDVTLDQFLSCLGTGINALFTNKSEGRRWIDKTPQYTLIVDLLVQMFPGAYFLHMLRDGRRVVNSMINFHNAPSRESQRSKFGTIPPWDFKNACQTWARYVDIGLDFCGRHPTRALTVINEDMVADPVQEFRRLFRFIRAPYQDEPAEYFSTHQINSSFRTGGRIEDGLASRFSDPWSNWSAEQQDIFGREAGPAQAKYIWAQEQGKLEYGRLVYRLSGVIVKDLPATAIVLVVSKGDDELVSADPSRIWHFPQTAAGRYAGANPADSADAVVQLEVLREKGANFLLFPKTAFWWLEYYADFRGHLDRNYGPMKQNDEFVLYDLGNRQKIKCAAV